MNKYLPTCMTKSSIIFLPYFNADVNHIAVLTTETFLKVSIGLFNTVRFLTLHK